MDDLISRAAAIDALRTCYDTETVTMDNGDEYINYGDAVGEIEQLPPALREQHHDEWCDSCKEYDKEKHCCPRWNRVIRQTLQDAQPEPCEDAVSRKAVQYLLAYFVNKDKYDDACDGLKHLPSVTPKQRTGKWIDGIIPNDGGGLPVIVCDQCNTFFPLQFGDGHNFCPNCGAKMEGDAE